MSQSFVNEIKEALSAPDSGVDVVAAVLAVNLQVRPENMSVSMFNRMMATELVKDDLDIALDVIKVHNYYRGFTGEQNMAFARFLVENFGKKSEVRGEGGYPGYDDDVQVVGESVDEELNDAHKALARAQKKVVKTRNATMLANGKPRPSADEQDRAAKKEDDALEALMSAQADLMHVQNKRQKRE